MPPKTGKPKSPVGSQLSTICSEIFQGNSSVTLETDNAAKDSTKDNNNIGNSRQPTEIVENSCVDSAQLSAGNFLVRIREATRRREVLSRLQNVFEAFAQDIVYRSIIAPPVDWLVSEGNKFLDINPHTILVTICGPVEQVVIDNFRHWLEANQFEQVNLSECSDSADNYLAKDYPMCRLNVVTRDILVYPDLPITLTSHEDLQRVVRNEKIGLHKILVKWDNMTLGYNSDRDNNVLARTLSANTTYYSALQTLPNRICEDAVVAADMQGDAYSREKQRPSRSGEVIAEFNLNDLKEKDIPWLIAQVAALGLRLRISDPRTVNPMYLNGSISLNVPISGRNYESGHATSNWYCSVEWPSE